MLGDHPINQGKPAETKLRRVGPSLVNTGYRPGMEREARMVLGQRAGKVFVWGGGCLREPPSLPFSSFPEVARRSSREGGWHPRRGEIRLGRHYQAELIQGGRAPTTDQQGMVRGSGPQPGGQPQSLMAEGP